MLRFVRPRISRLLTTLSAAVAAACASAPPVTLAPTPEPYPAVAPSSVQFYDFVYESDLPGRAVRIAVTPRRRPAWRQADWSKAFAALQQRAAPRGANAIVYPRPGAEDELVAVHFLGPTAFATADSLRSARTLVMRGGPSAVSGSTSAGVGTGAGGAVHVRGYCRRDGVCVQPHTRSRPGSGGRRRP